MSYYSGDRSGDYKQMSWPKPGINTVGEYQMSGQPFLLTFTLGAPGNAGDSSVEEKQLNDDDVSKLAKALYQNDVF